MEFRRHREVNGRGTAPADRQCTGLAAVNARSLGVAGVEANRRPTRTHKKDRPHLRGRSLLFTEFAFHFVVRVVASLTARVTSGEPSRLQIGPGSANTRFSNLPMGPLRTLCVPLVTPYRRRSPMGPLPVNLPTTVE